MVFHLIFVRFPVSFRSFSFVEKCAWKCASARFVAIATRPISRFFISALLVALVLLTVFCCRSWQTWWRRRRWRQRRKKLQYFSVLLHDGNEDDEVRHWTSCLMLLSMCACCQASATTETRHICFSVDAVNEMHEERTKRKKERKNWRHDTTGNTHCTRHNSDRVDDFDQ